MVGSAVRFGLPLRPAFFYGQAGAGRSGLEGDRIGLVVQRYGNVLICAGHGEAAGFIGIFALGGHRIGVVAPGQDIFQWIARYGVFHALGGVPDLGRGVRRCQ